MKWNIEMSPAGLGTKDRCAVEGQKQFTIWVDWYHVAHDRAQWPANVNMVLHFSG
jgi:hypothetical protein